MTEIDIPQKLIEYLDNLSSSSRYLLSFSPFFVNHFSAYLMSYFINVRDQRILYMCVGRPHIFIQKLLQNRGVPIRNIYFMDMVLGVSGNSAKNNRHKITYNNEEEQLEIPLIYKLYKVDQEVGQLSLDNIDLVILDNMTELRTYNNDDRVRSILDMLNSIWDRSEKGLMIYHINNRPGDGVGEIASDMGLETVRIPNEVFNGER